MTKLKQLFNFSYITNSVQGQSVQDPFTATPTPLAVTTTEVALATALTRPSATATRTLVASPALKKPWETSPLSKVGRELSENSAYS